MANITTQSPSSSGVHIALNKVTRVFDQQHAIAVPHLSIAASRFTVLLGRSGCGKSTLLNLIAGLDTPSEGEILLDGKTLSAPATDTALMFQQNNLFPWMSAHQNIAFALRARGADKHHANEAAQRLIDEVGLTAFGHQLPARLSGGMRQRIALARAIAMQPRLLLLDEPFSALDMQTRRMMHRHLLDVWHQTRATVVMVTHDLNEALQLADDIVLMSSVPSGRIARTIHIDLARPRDADLPAYRALYRQLDTHLEHEAMMTEHDGQLPDADDTRQRA